MILVPVDATMKSCTSIGILERQNQTCITILPSGRVRDTINNPRITSKNCHEYLASGYSGEIILWTKLPIYSFGPKIEVNYFICRRSELCRMIPFQNIVVFDECFSRPQKPKLTIWMQFHKPRIFGLAQCKFEEEGVINYFYINEEESPFIKYVDSIEEIIPSSVFYSISNINYPIKAFLFKASKMQYNVSPSVLALDL